MYTVKPGDTPSGIAEKTGVPLEDILALNPTLDPQTLAPGTKIRLRK
jgi:LysM repeat protein